MEKLTPQQIAQVLDDFEAMVQRKGAYKVAEKMMKLESFRKFSQKYPYDNAQMWRDTVRVEDIADFLPDRAVSVEEEVSIRMEMEELEDSLTPRQDQVLNGLISGMSNTEIEAAFGFKTNNAVRWQKHQVKRKYLKLKGEKVNEYICKECAWQWKQKSALNCPKCDSRALLCTRKNVPVIDE